MEMDIFRFSGKDKNDENALECLICFAFVGRVSC